MIGAYERSGENIKAVEYNWPLIKNYLCYSIDCDPNVNSNLRERIILTI